MNKKFQPGKHPRATGTKIIDNLDTARLLSDPFKLKILRYFAEQPRTTKQVADLMGEKAPRLYRHVDALLEHGILEVIHEQPKRGTIERYLHAVAARFEIDRGLFAPASDESDNAGTALRDILQSTGDEFIEALNQHEDDEELEPVIMKMGIKGTRQQLIKLRQHLLEWTEACQNEEPGSDDQLLEFNGLIAFYPSTETP